MLFTYCDFASMRIDSRSDELPDTGSSLERNAGLNAFERLLTVFSTSSFICEVQLWKILAKRVTTSDISVW